MKQKRKRREKYFRLTYNGGQIKDVKHRFYLVNKGYWDS